MPKSNRSTYSTDPITGGLLENVDAVPPVEDNTPHPAPVPTAASGEDIRMRPVEVNTLDTNPVETDYRATGSGTPGTWGPYEAQLRLWRRDFIYGAPETLEQLRP